MNLAAIFPWEAYAIHRADGITTHRLDPDDIDSVVQHLAASGVGRVLMVTARAIPGRGCDWCQFKNRLTDVCLTVTVIPSLPWRAYLESNMQSDPNSLLDFDEEISMKAQFLVEFARLAGVL